MNPVDWSGIGTNGESNMRLRQILFLLLALWLALAPVADATNISRLRDAEISNGNILDADDLDAEFDQIISSFNANDTVLTNVTTGTYTFSGVKTFSSSPKTNGIDERTTGSGVTIDSVLLKDGFIRVPAGAGFTPTTNGDLGYDSTSHTYDVYVNGSAKSLMTTGSGIDDLSDVTITTPSSGQGLLYNGSAWVNGAVGSMVLLASATASNSASIDFTSAIDSTYDEYVIFFNNVVPATNGAQLYMRVSTDSGSTWKSGGTDYGYTSTGLNSAGTAVSIASNGAAWMQIAGTSTADFGLGNAAGRSSRGRVEISLPSSSSINKKLGWKTGWSSEGGTNYLYTLSGEGEYRATTAINGIRFLMSSGNITSGSFYLYGIKK
jgi:hypothetical protein